MRLSTVFELLLIFLFIAFAASRSVDKHHQHHHHKHGALKSRQASVTKPASGPNRFCQCTSLMCNCCRDFSLPVVSLKGPGCANLQYVAGDSMRLTMSFGDRILRNITLSGKKPRPVCMGLPGAETRFCGRIYGIQRVGDQFKACLALELRSLDDVEAALRVSCFKFGPDGVKLEPGRPVPTDTDDYDDDDDYGFDDDDDDDDDDFLADDEDDDEENDVDSGDYTGFSALGDEFLDGFFGTGSSKKKKKTQAATSTAAPVKVTKKPTTAAVVTTHKPATKLPSTTLPPSTQETPAPEKASNKTTTVEISNEMTTASPSVITSTEFSVKVVQDGNTLDDVPSTSTGVPVEAVTVSDAPQTATDPLISTTDGKIISTNQSTVKPQEDNEEEDNEEEDDEEETEDGDEEYDQTSTTSLIENPKEKENNKPESKDDDENILDGILSVDDDEDDAEEDDEKDEEEDDDDEFRQLRSHIPRGPYQPMTLEDQERQFPGLSALIKPPSVPFMSLQEQERRFPGLAALIRPPPIVQPEMAFDFPPVRSARTHKRMRLPPV